MASDVTLTQYCTVALQHILLIATFFRQMPASANKILKGTNPDVDSYSAFFDNLGKGEGDTGLRSMLEEQGAKVVMVTGLATDYCVGYTALDAMSDRYN